MMLTCKNVLNSVELVRELNRNDFVSVSLTDGAKKGETFKYFVAQESVIDKDSITYNFVFQCGKHSSFHFLTIEDQMTVAWNQILFLKNNCTICRGYLRLDEKQKSLRLFQ